MVYYRADMYLNPSSSKMPSVLSFSVNTRGVGYSFFLQNKEHFWSEMISARKRDNARYLYRMKKYIHQFQPEILILEEYRKTKGGNKRERTSELIKAIALYAKQQGIVVYFYPRSTIREVFGFYHATTKLEIAQLIVFWMPILEERMYEPRSGEQTERYSSAIFSAISLVITYYYLNE